MDPNTLIPFLQNSFSESGAARTEAESQLFRLSRSAGYAVALFQLCMAPAGSVTAPVRQAGAIALKNHVHHHWSPRDESRGAIPDSEKLVVMENMVEALIHVEHTIRLQLEDCMSVMLQIQYPGKWPSLLGQIMHQFGTNEPRRIFGALYVLLLVSKRYEYYDDKDLTPVDEVINATFPILESLIVSLLPMEDAQASDMLHIIIKIFYCFIHGHMPQYLLDPARVDAWMAHLMSIFNRPVSAAVLALPADQQLRSKAWLAKKWVAHTAQRLFTRWGSPKTADDHLKGWAKHFLTTHAGIFLSSFLGLVDAHRRGTLLPKKLLTIALTYIAASIDLTATYNILRPHLATLLNDMLFPILCYNREDDESWNEDPQEYIRKMYDYQEEFYNPRAAAAELMCDLASRRTSDCLGAFLAFLSDILNRYQANPAELAISKDGALYALGALSAVLRKKKAFKPHLEPMIVAHVLPELNSSYRFLRAKACSMMSNFAPCIKDATHRRTAMLAIVSRLNDPELPVRVQAGLSFKALIRCEYEMDELIPMLPTIIGQYLSIMREVDNDELVNSLDSIIEKFADNVSPLASQLAGALADTVMKFMSEAGDEEGGSTNASLTIYSTIETISTLMHSACRTKEVYPAVEAAILPMVVRMLQPDACDFVEEVIGLVSCLTYYAPEISPGLWSCFPLLYNIFMADGFDYLGELLIPLDNFITRSTDIFLSGLGGVNFQSLIFNIVSKVLTGQHERSSDYGPGFKLVDLIFQSCKGRVDDLLDPYLSLVTACMSYPKVDNTMFTMIFDVFGNALYYSPQLTLALMEAKGWTMPIFGKWFTHLSEMKGHREKKACALGLTSLLAVPSASLPAVVRAHVNSIASAVVTLIKSAEEDRVKEDKDAEAAEGEDIWGGDSDEEEEVSAELLAEDGESTLSEAELAKKLKEARDLGDEWDGEDFDEDDLFGDEGYMYNVLDEVNEAKFFGETLQGLQASDSALFSALLAQLGPNIAGELGALSTSIDERIKRLYSEEGETEAAAASS